MLGTAEFLDALRQFSLLEAERLDDLQRKIQGRAVAARAVADKLIEKGWLTAYQVERLLNGRGNELVLGPYVVLDGLGKGGMGEVVKARHRILGRIDALKTIRSDSLQSEALVRRFVRRFVREAQAAARLRHANVVQVYGADQAGEVHYLALEYVEGTDLSALVDRDGPFPISVACEYVRQAALGLQHIHEAGLVHRDIKPSNLLLQPAAAGKSAVVKVLDLGLARFEAGAANDGAGRLTGSGAVIGTPDFLAPEQTVNAHGVDARADLYSLGCSLYFLLTGEVPFPGGMLIHKVVAHQMHQPEAVEKLRPDTPREVAAIIRKLMAKNPEERFQSAAEVITALTRIGERRPQPPPLPASSPRAPDTRLEAPPTQLVLPGSDSRPWDSARWVALLTLALLLAMAMGGCLLFVLVRPRATDTAVASRDIQGTAATAAGPTALVPPSTTRPPVSSPPLSTGRSVLPETKPPPPTVAPPASRPEPPPETKPPKPPSTEVVEEAIIDKAIKAQGGMENLKRFPGLEMKSKGKFYGLGDAVDYTAEQWYQVPDRLKLSLDGGDFKFVQVLNGKKGWVKFKDDAMEMPEAALEEGKQEMHVQGLARLLTVTDKGLKLSSTGEMNIDGHAGIGVRIEATGYRAVTLYFDKDSGLLLKTERPVKDPSTGKESITESLYSDYKKVGNFQIAHKIKVNRDGKTYLEGEVTEAKPTEKFDDSVFEKP
jgi:serine/threonine-protein kinase